jgi:beta-glucanase (GH16 family)
MQLCEANRVLVFESPAFNNIVVAALLSLSLFLSGCGQNSAVTANAPANSPSGSTLTHMISGTISPSSLGTGSVLTLSGAAGGTAVVDAAGNYSFAQLADGNYTVTPNSQSATFLPASLQVILNNADVSGANFTATAIGVPTYSVSGTISPVSLGAGSIVTLSGAASAATTADKSGNYSFTVASSGSFTVTPSSTSAAFSPASQSVTVAGANVSAVNFTATATSNVVFYDDFTSPALGAAWTVISRHGEYSQSETECNVPRAVSVANSLLTITSTVGPATCGDAQNAPSSWPYVTGDVQWSSFNFTYGTVTARAKFPAKSTGLWPAIWLLGSNCQASNPLTGATPYGTCPALNSSNYTEIDMVECDLNNWCQLALANEANTGSGGATFPTCGFPVDGNFHVFTLTWTATSVSVAVDGQPTGCAFNSPTWTIPSTPMFLILQTQTGGAGGSPNNTQLPATFQIDYVKVTQP